MNNPYAVPHEDEIVILMALTGFDRIPAINHLRQRAMLKDMPDRRFHDEPISVERRATGEAL